MPISNPIVQIQEITQEVTVINQGSSVTIDTVNPQIAPIAPKSFWFNSVDSRLFLAINTNSVNDWVEVSSSLDELDWNQIINKPTVFPAVVQWSQIFNKPTVFPAYVEWAGIANKPTMFPANAADILEKIVIENNAVLTDGKNVIFED